MAQFKSVPVLIFFMYILLITLVMGGQNVEHNVREVAQTMVTSIFNTKSPINVCRWVRKVSRKHRSWCRDQGVKKILLTAGNMAVKQCQEQFRYDHWNCTVNHKDINFLENGKVFRETALMYAMTAAALTHTVAKSCASGILKRCRCVEETNREETKRIWRWGICHDDYDYARRFTRRFLHLRRQVYANPLHGSIVRHNIIVGIQAVGEMKNMNCKCHGVSGSCTTKTCWKRLKPFKETAELLRGKYYQAQIRDPSNRASPEKKQKRLASNDTLLYMERSPDFCLSTRGRRCQDPYNCNTLCCCRGYNSHPTTVTQQCRCQWIRDYQLSCENCSVTQDIYVCK